jgi:heme-degrading monooxygenase HmoA
LVRGKFQISAWYCLGEEGPMHARVSFYDLAGGRPDDAVSAFASAQEAVEKMQGNQGAMLLVNRADAKAISITFWNTEDDLRATTEQANQARQQVADRGGLSIRAVEPYEVALEFGR